MTSSLVIARSVARGVFAARSPNLHHRVYPNGSDRGTSIPLGNLRAVAMGRERKEIRRADSRPPNKSTGGPCEPPGGARGDAVPGPVYSRKSTQIRNSPKQVTFAPGEVRSPGARSLARGS